MFCEHCGKRIADNSRFCQSCGKPLTRPAASAAAPPGQPVPPVQAAPLSYPAPPQAAAASIKSAAEAPLPVILPIAAAVCNLPAGLTALYARAKGAQAMREGDGRAAGDCRRKSLIWSVTGYGCGLASVLMFIVRMLS